MSSPQRLLAGIGYQYPHANGNIWRFRRIGKLHAKGQPNLPMLICLPYDRSRSPASLTRQRFPSTRTHTSRHSSSLQPLMCPPIGSWAVPLLCFCWPLHQILPHQTPKSSGEYSPDRPCDFQAFCAYCTTIHSNPLHYSLCSGQLWLLRQFNLLRPPKVFTPVPSTACQGALSRDNQWKAARMWVCDVWVPPDEAQDRWPAWGDTIYGTGGTNCGYHAGMPLDHIPFSRNQMGVKWGNSVEQLVSSTLSQGNSLNGRLPSLLRNSRDSIDSPISITVSSSVSVCSQPCLPPCSAGSPSPCSGIPAATKPSKASRLNSARPPSFDIQSTICHSGWKWTSPLGLILYQVWLHHYLLSWKP